MFASMREIDRQLQDELTKSPLGPRIPSQKERDAALKKEAEAKAAKDKLDSFRGKGWELAKDTVDKGKNKP